MRLEERPFGGSARGALRSAAANARMGQVVLFVTGLCSFHCFYCPVSDEKDVQDVVFADEKRVTRDEDVLEEAHAIRATGAGITGGDPLDAVERTCITSNSSRPSSDPGSTPTCTPCPPTNARSGCSPTPGSMRFGSTSPGLWSRAANSSFVAASVSHGRSA